LPTPAQGRHHLLERQHRRDVVRFEAKARNDPSECDAPALTSEIGLGVLLWESGVGNLTWPRVSRRRTPDDRRGVVAFGTVVPASRTRLDRGSRKVQGSRAKFRLRGDSWRLRTAH
jgi:hypothetical protein